ncbi:hypothetical protein OsJ_13789 [Oryza sativa Japonica Group]|uniref:NADP-dependent oxidoreductase domain-containing protein n=1 Tax=Oryza sativa subsp. japonica TaxID=39947 RepID=B9FDM7_ORYSJ|nr:hypothetical protein OsJ_13789 [Oryza sativa Japonica Group]
MAASDVHHGGATPAAAATAVPCVTLNSGHAMPVLGFGTGSSTPPADLAATIAHAVRFGYRHLDTAAVYGTEGPVRRRRRRGRALRRPGVPRRAVRHHQALHGPTRTPPRVVAALRESLSRLGLDYVDLFLIHWPVAIGKKDAAGELTWDDLSRGPGAVRHGGRVARHGGVPPAGPREEKVREVCGEGGVVVAAYSPLGAHGAHWGSDAVMNSGVLHDVAAARCKTIAQVALRWLYEQGVCMVARSFNEGRMKQNMDIFDWELSDQDKAMIAGVPQRRACHGNYFVSPDGPYKSLHDLWDGEI